MKKKLGLVLLAIIFIFIGIRISKDTPEILDALDENREIEIVIDPGHGGNDPGTMSSNGVYEKDINLEIAKKLYIELESRGYGVKITRDDDSFLKSMERVHMANLENAKVFISLHCNAVEEDESIKGLQILYYPSESSRGLSEVVMESILDSSSLKDKGRVERKDLIVLNQTTMPAIIIEMGFLSNREEARDLQRNSFQDKIVNGIANGLEEYLSIEGGKDEKTR